MAVPKHKSRGLTIEKPVISLYAKWMSVSNIEEMREIYEIEISISAVTIIIHKVDKASQEWQGRPLPLSVSLFGWTASSLKHGITARLLTRLSIFVFD